jgi:hypothetical protein
LPEYEAFSQIGGKGSIFVKTVFGKYRFFLVLQSKVKKAAMTLSITTLSIATFSITTLSITTLSTVGLFATLSIIDTELNSIIC